MINYIMLLLLLLLLIAGIFEIFDINMKSPMKNMAIAEIEKSEKYIESNGLQINLDYYNSIRFGIMFFLAILGYMNGNILNSLIIILILLFLSMPTNEFMKRETVFYKFTEMLRKERGTRLNQELFNNTIILKNLVIVQQDKPMSADFVFEQLMENSKALKVAYIKMLTLYRAGKEDEAYNVLSDYIGTKEARNFTTALKKLDEINPIELLEQVLVFQDAMEESRMTANLKKADRNAIIVTTVSSATIFALLLNFMVVVVFMDMLNLLNNMFN